MPPKISVIMPMYNVEKYIRTSVESVLNQTFGDFELILVDDCSTDRTSEIAKSFKDSRIKVIKTKQNNGMPGPVRNVGLKLACGEYIYFMDSDDAIVPHAFELLINAVNFSHADIVGSILYYVPKDNEFQKLDGIDCSIKTWGKLGKPAEDLQARLTEEFCHGKENCLIWQKLYSHKLLKDNEIEFRSVHCEDQVFLIETLCATD